MPDIIWILWLDSCDKSECQERDCQGEGKFHGKDIGCVGMKVGRDWGYGFGDSMRTIRKMDIYIPGCVARKLLT